MQIIKTIIVGWLLLSQFTSIAQDEKEKEKSKGKGYAKVHGTFYFASKGYDNYVGGYVGAGARLKGPFIGIDFGIYKHPALNRNVVPVGAQVGFTAMTRFSPIICFGVYYPAINKQYITRAEGGSITVLTNTETKGKYQIKVDAGARLEKLIIMVGYSRPTFKDINSITTMRFQNGQVSSTASKSTTEYTLDNFVASIGIIF